MRLLQCLTCDSGACEFERGWRAYRLDAERETNVIVLCPECAERELGEDSC
jgi:hypothetical protein